MPNHFVPTPSPDNVPYEIEIDGIQHRYLYGSTPHRFSEHISYLTACDLTGRESRWGFRPRTEPFVSEAFCLTCWSGVLLDGVA